MQVLPETKSYQRKHQHMRSFHQNKNDCLLLNEPFFWDQPRTKIHFILSAMKINVNRIAFMVGQNFISGLMKALPYKFRKTHRKTPAPESLF